MTREWNAIMGSFAIRTFCFAKWKSHVYCIGMTSTGIKFVRAGRFAEKMTMFLFGRLHINMHMAWLITLASLHMMAWCRWLMNIDNGNWAACIDGDRAACIWAAVWTGEAWPASGGKARGKSDIACRGLREEPNFASYSARAIWSIIQFVCSGLGMATCPTCGAAER